MTQQFIDDETVPSGRQANGELGQRGDGEGALVCAAYACVRVSEGARVILECRDVNVRTDVVESVVSRRASRLLVLCSSGTQNELEMDVYGWDRQGRGRIHVRSSEVQKNEHGPRAPAHAEEEEGRELSAPRGERAGRYSLP